MERGFRHDILKDLKEFARFFGSLWGLLAGVSLFFPFANLVFRAVRCPDEAARNECLALALLTCAFVFLAVYRSRSAVHRLDSRDWAINVRGRYRRMPWLGHRTTVAAAISFCLLLIGYLSHVGLIYGGYYGPPQRNLAQGVLLYALVFALATLSFTILGTAEYMRQIKLRETAVRAGTPSPAQGRSAIFDRLPPEERPSYPGQLRVIEERLVQEGDTTLLVVTAESRLGRRYRVQVDGEDIVHFFQMLDS